MKKETVIIIFLVVTIVMILSTWAYTVMPNARTWQKVDSWNFGQFSHLNLNYYNTQNNNVTTNDFQITGDQWSITWGMTGSASISSHYVIRVFDADDDTLIREINTIQLETSDNRFELSEKGRFYLQIFINGVESWEIKVSEFK